MNDYTDPEVNILYSEGSIYSTRSVDEEASLQSGNTVANNTVGGGDSGL